MAKFEIIKRPVGQVGDDIKKMAWSSIIESLLILILGVLLVVWPDTIVKILAYLVGTFFMVKGGFQVISYFMEKGQKDFFNNRLLAGVVSILIGIVAFAMGENIASVFRVVIGIIVIYASLIRINTAAKLANAGIAVWRYMMVLSLLMLVIGIFVTFNTGAIVSLVGWMMVLVGIVGIVDGTMFIQHVNTVVEKVVNKN